MMFMGSGESNSQHAFDRVLSGCKIHHALGAPERPTANPHGHKECLRRCST